LKKSFYKLLLTGLPAGQTIIAWSRCLVFLLATLVTRCSNQDEIWAEETDHRPDVPWAPLNFLQTGCPSCHPTDSVKALKAKLLQ